MECFYARGFVLSENPAATGKPDLDADTGVPNIQLP